MSRYEDLIDLLRRAPASIIHDNAKEAAAEMEKADARIQELQRENAELLAFARRDGPLFRHKNNTLYQEVCRAVATEDYRENEVLRIYRDYDILVTDDIAKGEEYVEYRNAKGEYFRRPARLFDEPERFRRLE